MFPDHVAELQRIFHCAYVPKNHIGLAQIGRCLLNPGTKLFKNAELLLERAEHFRFNRHSYAEVRRIANAQACQIPLQRFGEPCRRDRVGDWAVRMSAGDH